MLSLLNHGFVRIELMFMQIIQQAFCLNQFLPSLDKKSFNKHNEYLFTNLIEYVQLHYLTKKQNTSFWKDICLPNIRWSTRKTRNCKNKND